MMNFLNDLVEFNEVFLCALVLFEIPEILGFIYSLLVKKIYTFNNVTFVLRCFKISEALEVVKKIPNDFLRGLEGYTVNIVSYEVFGRKSLKRIFDFDSNVELYIDEERKTVFLRNKELQAKLLCLKNNLSIVDEMTIRGVKVIFDGANFKYYNTIKVALKKLPKHVLENFANMGGVVYVVSKEVYKKMDPKYDSRKIAGFYRHATKEIVIFSNSTHVVEFLDTVWHEFGHFIDYNYAGEYLASDNLPLHNLFNEAKKNYKKQINKYYLSSTIEFFAFLSSEYFRGEAMTIPGSNEVFKNSFATNR